MKLSVTFGVIPDDVQVVVHQFYSGTTVFGRVRIREWNDRAIWCSVPGGEFWSGVGFKSYAPVWHVLLPRDPTRVRRIQGALCEWRGKTPFSVIRKAMIKHATQRKTP